MMPASSAHKPICVFACRWCSLIGAERAGRERLPLPPEIRLLPVPCAGSVSLDMLLHAFASGAVGVAVLGCHLGGCRHEDANRDAHARLTVLADLLETSGIGRNRLCISWGTAHEAAQYAHLMNDFARSLQDLPPLPEFFHIPKNQAEALTAVPERSGKPLPLSGEEDTAQDLTLRAAVIQTLEKGHMVLALGRVQSGVIPDLFVQKEDVQALVSGPKFPLAKLAGSILRERVQGSLKPNGIHQSLREQAFALRNHGLSVACRACDARALYQMADLHQFPRELLDLIAIPCSTEQQKACCCTRPQWPGDNKVLSHEGSITCEGDIDWLAQFSRCVQCHRCRIACPVCVCPDCALDDSATHPSSMQPFSSPMLYHLTRALHVADCCVQCGACQEACPQGLPLLQLHQSVAVSMENLGYKSGEGMISPLRGSRHKNEVPQWQDSLKGGMHA